MPEIKLPQHILLPELVFESRGRLGMAGQVFKTFKKRSKFEVCPKCATPSSSVYDHREVFVRDDPMRGKDTYLRIKKRRYYCKACRKPFTEPVSGIMPRRRTTQRYRRSLLWACENFKDLTSVKKAYRCSSSLMYKVLYEQLSVKLSQFDYPWPKTIGIDEHFFSRTSSKRFATVFTDMTNKRVRTIVHGKTRKDLKEGVKYIAGRENVRWVTIDLSDTYKGFVFEHFPHAQIVADKFHVLRLLTPHILKRRKDIAPSRMEKKAKRLFTMSSKKLDYYDRLAIRNYLKNHPELEELYVWKERLFGFYRIKGYYKARNALENMLIEMALSSLPEIRRLRRTLSRWKNEVLNDFINRLTNARTAGYNNIAKLVQKRAFGYKNFENYKLRFLSACAY